MTFYDHKAHIETKYKIIQRHRIPEFVCKDQYFNKLSVFEKIEFLLALISLNETGPMADFNLEDEKAEQKE